MRSHRAWLLVLVLLVDQPAHASSPPATLACVQAAFKDARYASSDGGPCGMSISLDELIEP